MILVIHSMTIANLKLMKQNYLIRRTDVPELNQGIIIHTLNPRLSITKSDELINHYVLFSYTENISLLSGNSSFHLQITWHHIEMPEKKLIFFGRHQKHRNPNLRISVKQMIICSTGAFMTKFRAYLITADRNTVQVRNDFMVQKLGGNEYFTDLNIKV
ncbi:hypothetical protein LOAG_01255 [Loa loa]|uniref:Uncharacterized protein n=1 Tax=Loa loa TaxID=7209 RepID=A0A1S0U9M4_LOALO|nr:hypothetical protein LOAG_01255 [Loa loa]EFO27226.1 hypothetical protein LOAG_01255 [Loa loa]